MQNRSFRIPNSVPEEYSAVEHHQLLFGDKGSIKEITEAGQPLAGHVPNAGQPMRNENERGHQQDEDGSSIFRIPVNLAGHSDKAQQSGRFQQPNERGRLKETYKFVAIFATFCGIFIPGKGFLS